MANVVDSYPLSPLQEGMLFNALYAPHSGVDVTQIICRMHHPLDPVRFGEAWRAVVARHAILRTAFRWEGLETPLQDVYGEADLEYVVEDLRDRPAGEREARIEEFLAADRRRGFDIASPPLVRIAVFLLGENENVLVWPYHHLILDATSFAIILEEVFALYETRLAGGGLALEEPTPYR
ncbi:MAG: non-ribosomal peptide synthetase, partial [Candidatus Krumholzibacteriota bacterium]|nr:non-ribosomal peptide synthetase [Candidatus Krumholzibacteriota bacterium]